MGRGAHVHHLGLGQKFGNFGKGGLGEDPVAVAHNHQGGLFHLGENLSAIPGGHRVVVKSLEHMGRRRQRPSHKAAYGPQNDYRQSKGQPRRPDQRELGSGGNQHQPLQIIGIASRVGRHQRAAEGVPHHHEGLAHLKGFDHLGQVVHELVHGVAGVRLAGTAMPPQVGSDHPVIGRKLRQLILPLSGPSTKAVDKQNGPSREAGVNVNHAQAHFGGLGNDYVATIEGQVQANGCSAH